MMPPSAEPPSPAWPKIADRVTVVGAGAIGGFVAGVVADERPEVELTAVTGRPFDLLRVQTRDEAFEVAIPLLADARDVAQRPDWVLLATKAHQIGDVADWLAALIGPSTSVAVLQNGIGHAKRVAAFVPPERVLPVVVRLSAHRDGPGRIVARSRAVLTVPDTDLAAPFAALVGGGRIEVDVDAEFDRAMFRKLCLNISGGAIAAVAGRPLAEIEDDRLATIAGGLIDECVAVAAAEGVALDGSDTGPILEWVLHRRSKGAPSTLQDRLAGSPLEIDARNGAVVALGERHGIPTPWNSAVVAVLANAHEVAGDLLDDMVALATQV
jgi:2-dehydropantoate 2-reductase